MDWQRGKIPYFVPPPNKPVEPNSSNNMQIEIVNQNEKVKIEIDLICSME